MSLEQEDLDTISKHLTYKPDVAIRLSIKKDLGFFSITQMTLDSSYFTEDSERQKKTVKSLYSTFSLDYNKEQVIELLKENLYKFETHEVDEWLRYKGIRITNPHPENKITTQFSRLTT